MLKIKSNLYYLSLILPVIFGTKALGQTNASGPVVYVDNRIGVIDDHSNCVIGPQLPHGSVNPSPQTVNGGDDGYHPDKPIRGFGQMHVSGTGWGTNGQFLLSPQIGLTVDESGHDSPKSNEVATAYEYRTDLDRYHIGVSLTPAKHAVIYKLRFPKSDSSHLLLDITHNIPMDIKPIIGGVVSAGEISFDNSEHTRISGYGIYRGGFGGGDYKLYFCAEISKTPEHHGTWLNGQINSGSGSQKINRPNDRVGAFYGFRTRFNEEVFFKIAVSYKSVQQARHWLAEEIPGWNYDDVRVKGRSIWNEQLSRIDVEGGSENDKRIFYTALYHANLMPRDRTDDTPKYGSGVPFWDDHFAVWDTWRTVYPLHALINPDVVAGTVNSFIARYKRNGFVKDALINGNEMPEEQGGNNIDNIIADAYVKGVSGIDWTEAYKVLKHDADFERRGSFAWRKQDSALNTYKRIGWIPSGTMSCSMTLEYAYNDYCISEVAKGLHKTEDHKKYLLRSGQWINLWNSNAEDSGFKGFIQPRTINGDFVPIDLRAYPGSWKNYFYEGSSWNYSWFMPHQFEKLVALNGSGEEFVKKLNYGFEKGLINYGNEPAFLAVHEFIYAGRPDLTSYWVKQLMNKSFTLKGYPGNDDSGAMSSWYVFSAMGFFPNAGQDIYYLTGPAFEKISIRLPGKHTLTIRTNNSSKENIYVQEIKVNGKKWNGSMISHKELINSGMITFTMGSKPARL